MIWKKKKLRMNFGFNYYIYTCTHINIPFYISYTRIITESRNFFIQNDYFHHNSKKLSIILWERSINHEQQNYCRFWLGLNFSTILYNFRCRSDITLNFLFIKRFFWLSNFIIYQIEFQEKNLSFSVTSKMTKIFSENTEKMKIEFKEHVVFMR